MAREKHDKKGSYRGLEREKKRYEAFLIAKSNKDLYYRMNKRLPKQIHASVYKKKT